jgi:outer membrane protein TolC
MKRIGSIWLLFTIIITGLGAEETVLNLENSINLALENNLDYKISAIDLETAQREDRHGWNNYLPDVTLSGGLTDSDTLSDSDEAEWSVWGDVDVSLTLSAETTRTVKGLELARDSESLILETARLELINEVEKDFYSLIASQRDIEIEKANLDLAEKRYEYTENKFNKGLATELSVLQAKVSAADLKPSYIQALSDYETDRREFLTLIGLDSEATVEIEGVLDVPMQEFNSDSLIEAYLMNRRDILEAQMDLEILKNSRDIEAADNRAPSLNLSAGWTPEIDDPFEGNFSSSDSFDDSLSLSAYLSVPLDSWVPGSSDDDDIRSYDDQVRAAELTLENTIQDGRTEILNLVAQMETAAANLELAELNVELYKLTYQKSEESYNQGGMEQLDLEDAQQDYFSSEQDYLESKYSYLEGQINLRYALGLEGLEEITQ